MDFLDAVGMGDKVVGLIKGGSYPDHLAKYVENEEIVNVGSMKDPDMEESCPYSLTSSSQATELRACMKR